MAAVQQHTPSSGSRRSKDFMESMEEEVRRCSDMLQRRQSKRGMRTLNGFARVSDSEKHSGDEAGVGRRFSSTLPRSFTMPSNPETREIPMPHHSRQKSRSPSGSRQQSNRSPRTPTMKAPIGATFHAEREQQKTADVYRGRSAPPESTAPYSSYYGASSSGSEFGYSSRESSVTPLGMANRSSSESPRSSMSPPPVAPKPTKSREKGWTNMRKVNGNVEESPRMIKALPETSSRSPNTIPVSNQSIQLPTSPMPMEFPSAEVDATTFGGFGEIAPKTPPLKSDPRDNTTPQSEHETTTEGKLSDNSSTSLDNIQITECDQIDSNEPENKSPSEAETQTSPELAVSPVEPEQSPTAVTPDSKESSPSPPVTVDPKISDEQMLNELTSPEVKTVPKKIRHRSVSREESSKHGSDSPNKRHSRTLSESKIHITVSSSVKMEDVVQSADKKALPPMDEKVAAMIKDLQAKLQEKEEQLSIISEQREKELNERDEQIKKLAKDNKKVEREKWELLKRARDAAERALHLRTQLDMKEGSIRSTQSELDRTKDELFSVKSANTSLRALLTELRAPQGNANTAGVSIGVQVDIGGGTLKRNRSIELAFNEGGLSQEQQLETPASPERSSSFHTSTTSLSTHWPLERTNSDREEAVSLCEDMSHFPTGMSASQPTVPWPELKKGKKKKTGLLTGRLRRSTGSKRGSVTSVDGLDMSNSSILQGSGLRGTGPITFPYHVLPSDMKEHWKVLEQAQSVPFQDWTLQHVMAWIEAGLGMNQYSDAVREKAPSGAALLTLSDSDLEKKLGITHPLHRRKLRLAIEEQRDTSGCQFPQAGKIDHSWVAFEWAHDCGLAHLTELLISNLVDGRLLNTLSKEDIRKHLKINKKSDQLSFLSAVELLRMHDFNRQAIQDHRRTANNPLYWTNRDVCDWLKDIQLEEYATNVIGGGVHGALLFLERGRFTTDHLASIIQIPSSKGQLRRHLAGKMARLFTEDISQSVESLPTHVMMSGSPARVSPQPGSQSPDRRHTHDSPHHQNTSPTPPPADCPHPSRKNSLSRRSQPLLFEALSQPVPAGPRQFGRVNSGPSPRQQRLSQVAAAERVRLSLRESALRSVSSINEESPQANRPDIPTRSFTPTLVGNSSGTTV